MDRAEMQDLILDDRARGIFRVNRRVFTDPEILEQERREVFDRSWLYAGHESEIANPGDFVTRRVGGRPVILVRDADGTARAFLNTCPHGGNIVCRERTGSTRLFCCFYHAWAFDLGGHLAAVPGDDAYTPAFDREALGLQPVPRLECYRGMMFVSFDPAIESLPSYLGDAREYLDLMLEFGGEDTEIVHGSQAYSMKANWKLLVENSMDGYHAMPTHQRFFNQYLADIGHGYGELGRPQPHPGHRSRPRQRPCGHRKPRAGVGDHRHSEGGARPDPRAAHRAGHARAGASDRRLQPEPLHLPQSDPDLLVAHDPHLVSAGARLHRDRRLGQPAAGRVAGIAAAALRELHLVPRARRVRHTG